MQALYDFAKGPLFATIFLFMVLGLTRRGIPSVVASAHGPEEAPKQDVFHPEKRVILCGMVDPGQPYLQKPGRFQPGFVCLSRGITDRTDISC